MNRALPTLLCLSLSLSGSTLAATLAGPDADQNGIRDDVDAYIAEHVSAASGERAAAQAYARAVQGVITGQRSSGGGTDPLRTLLQSGASGAEGWAREVRMRTINTGARLDAYVAALDAAGPAFLPLHPAGERECPSGACTVVVFQNGILTSEETALKSVAALRRLLGERVADQRLLYALNYNPTEGLRDFVEVFRQKFGEQDGGAAAFAGTLGEPAAVSDMAASLVRARVAAAAQPPTTLGGWVGVLTQPQRLLTGTAAVPTPEEIVGTVRQYTDAYLGQLVRTTVRMRQRLGSSTYMDDNARQLTDGVEAYLRRGFRVVLVAHSQGNLYAEIVDRELARRGSPTNRFAVVGIAVPNDRAPAGGPYVSTQADIVLGALRVVFPVLEANDRSVAPGQPGGAFMGHAFVDVYTHPGSAVANRVSDALRRAIEQVAGR